MECATNDDFMCILIMICYVMFGFGKFHGNSTKRFRYMLIEVSTVNDGTWKILTGVESALEWHR